MDLTPSRLGDRRLEPVGMIDAPGRAVRPVDPDAVADLAAEQVVAGHAERLGLDVEQRVLDGAERQRHHAAGGRPRRGKQFGVDPLVLVSVLADHARREPLDRRGHAGRAKSLVILAPADDAVLGHDLDEVVVPPAGVAGKRLDASDLGGFFHGFPARGLLLCWLITTTDRQARQSGKARLVWPGLTRPSTSFLLWGRQSSMPGTSPGMTR